MEVEVLFSNDGILALNKPPGMCSQGPMTSKIPELWELLRIHYPSGNIAHRIDKFTSGINLAGTSKKRTSYLTKNWHQITRKSYLAIINSPAWSERIVDTPIKGKSAITTFTMLERLGSLALFQCQLTQNGRMHQIRRHLKSIGSPIVGDWKYGGPKTKARHGQLLHAWRTELRLPNKSWVIIQAPIPNDFKQFDFDWNRWNTQANTALGVWIVSSGWQR